MARTMSGVQVRLRPNHPAPRDNVLTLVPRPRTRLRLTHNSAPSQCAARTMQVRMRDTQCRPEFDVDRTIALVLRFICILTLYRAYRGVPPVRRDYSRQSECGTRCALVRIAQGSALILASAAVDSLTNRTL